MNVFSPNKFRQQFPLLKAVAKNGVNSGSSTIYLDNAATTQKPYQVIAREVDYYEQENANVHRSSHRLGGVSTMAFEESRQLVQNFIGAHALHEIIWTKGATESINLVTQSLARNVLTHGDEIVLSVSEHHANIVPWQLVAEQTGAVIKTLPVTEQGYIDVSQLNTIITNKTRFVACAHISNVLGRINPIADIISKAKSVGAITLIDGAQAVAHLKVDVEALDCDFYVFSAHKMFGPTGVGVLYGKQNMLNRMSPYQAGGEMIEHVSFEKGTTFNKPPFKFEAGTPNIAGVIAFGECLKFVSKFLNDENKAYQHYELSLTKYCYEALAKINSVQFIVNGKPDVGVIAFYVEGHHNHDIATSLDSHGFAIRNGQHCAMPLMQTLNLDGCLRVSLCAYNTESEIDAFVSCLQNIINESEQIPHLPDEHSLISPNNDEVQMVIERFSNAKSWDSKHRELMLLGKKLLRMDKSKRNKISLISGCESSAWLIIDSCNHSKYQFIGDSDTKVVRGLLFIVLTICNNKTAKEIENLKIEDYFESLGIVNHLSPSRNNGLLAIVERVKDLVTQ